MEEINGGVKIEARAPGDGKLAVIEDAPGAYVSLRLGVEKAESKTGSKKQEPVAK
jgi:hypothetical protein